MDRMKLANVSQVQLTTHIYHHFSNLQIFQTSINSCIFEKPLRLSTYDFFAQHQPSPNHLWPSFAHSLLLFPFWLHQNIYYLASGLWQINKFNISLQYMKQKVCAPPRMKIKCLGQSRQNTSTQSHPTIQFRCHNTSPHLISSEKKDS